MEVEWSILYKTVFLDRDGLINQQAPEHDYIKTWEEFHFLPGVPQAIHELSAAGYLILVVTNQRGVARGMLQMENLTAIHERMCQELAACGAYIQKVYVCPHEIGTCSCRKPNIGLFLQAECDFEIDKENSWMIGDSDSDVEAGHRYGVKTIKSSDLHSAVKQILASHRIIEQAAILQESDSQKEAL